MEERDNSGALFKNDKDGNEARPDYRGIATVNGVKMRISAWLKKAKTDGKTYMSLAFDEDNGEQRRGGNQRQAAPSQRPPQRDRVATGGAREMPGPDDDDCPFMWSGRDTQPL